jgi:hypothetical protein
MKTELKDVIHFYWGQECERWHVQYLKGSNAYRSKIDVEAIRELAKPILRPLSSMTEEEARELFKHQYGDEKYNRTMLRFAFQYSPDAFRYLLSKGFDLFSLIENGQALEKQS